MSQLQPMLLPVTYDDLKKITIPHAAPVEVVSIAEKDGFVLNKKFTSDFRIRKAVYEKLLQAQKKLPAGWRFMVYEAYRPLKKQVVMWNDIMGQIRKKYPAFGEAEILALTETFIANPYDGIGSGHQACCAIDISLCDATGVEVDMGTGCQEIDMKSVTACNEISDAAQKNRKTLVEALESAGLINYPAEWWHFSYGDHQWAFLTGVTQALYGPIDI